MVSSLRRRTQKKVEAATWADDRRLTILHGKCWLTRFGGTIFLLSGLTFAILPFVAPREGKELAFAITGLTFGVPVILMGLGFLVWRMHRVIDLDSARFTYGSSLFHRKRERSIPLQDVRKVRIVSHSIPRYGITHAVYLDGRCGDRPVSVYLHEFPNNLARAQQFGRLVSRMMQKSRHE